MKTSRLLLPALVLSALAVPAMAAIRPCATPITLSPPSLTAGTTGLAYSQTLTAAGGTAFTFSTTQGVLPPGLAFANPTATTVDIAGSPTAPGTFVFTVTARNTPNGCSGGRTFAVFVNDRTVVTTTAGTTVFVEDGGPVVVDSGLTVSDSDSPNLASATVTITNPQNGAAEVLAATSCAGLTVTPGPNTLGITGSQPPAAYQSCLRSVTYDNSSQNRGTTPRVLSFVANDGTASSAIANKTVSVAGSDDPPVANPISPAAFNEDAAAVIPLSYTDPDGDLATACAVSSPTNVTVSTPCACTTGVCTVGVTGSPLNYNGPASFTFTVTANAQVSNSATATLSITAVDDAPVANAIAPSAFNEDTQSLITLSYSDVESDLATACAVSGPTNVTVSTPCACTGGGVCTVGVTGAPLNYNGSASFSYTVTANAQTSNSASASLTITPVNDPPVANAISPAAFNEDTQSLITLSYTDVETDLATACAVSGPTNVTVSTACSCTVGGVCTVGVTGSPLHYNGSASFSYTVTAAAQTSNSATASLTITPVADPPVANAITPPAFDEDVASVITLSYTDPDGDQATACAVSSPTNVTVSTACACSGGVCTVGVTGTPLNHNGAASFSYTVTANAQTSNSATATLTITAVNDAPVLGGVAGGFTYTENDAVTAIAPALTVTDVDSTTLSSATVTVTANFQSGQDVLSFVNGAGMGNIAGSTAGAVLTLTSAGSTATTAQWQTALRAVRYNNSSDDPNTSVRTVTFQVNDGAAANNLSNQVSRTITVTAVNDAPTANAFSNQPAQAGIPITYPAGKLGGTDLEAGTTITIDLTPINVTGGTVSLNANGSFTFTPLPASTTGSFQYRVSDNGNPAPGVTGAYATVTFTVAGPAIYFVKSAAVGLANCTLGNECTLGQALTSIGASTSARIFISDANSHGSAVPLNSGGWLIGQGVTGTTFDALFGIGAPAQGTLATRPSLALTRPTVTNTVTLNTSGAVRGLNISSAAATGITDIAGAITGALVSEVAVTTTTGTGINFSNTAGTFSFSAVTTTGGAGVSLTGTNTGATFSFSSLAISSGGNAAFTATGGGTVTATQDNVTIVNTLTTTTGTALNVANTTIGAGGLTFRSISANGGANGIILNNTGASGGLTVTGIGTTGGSGGFIQNVTTRGASVVTAVNLTLRNMTFINTPTADFPAGPTGLSLGNNTADNAAIHLQVVTNATLDNLTINGSAEQGINGHNVTNFTLNNSVLVGVGNGPDEDGIHFFNMLGTCAITNTAFTSSGDDNVNIQNNTNLALPAGMTPLGTLAITGGSANTGVQGSGYLMGIRGTMNITVTVDGVTANNNFSGGIVIDTFDTATSSIEIMNSTSTNNNDAISMSSNNGNTKFDIHDNVSFAGTDFGRINILKAAFSTTGTLQGKIRNNPIVVTDGQAADGVFIFQAGAGALTVAITNNSFDYRGTQRAIAIQGGQDGGGTLDTTVTGNTFDMKLDGTGNAVTGIFAQAAVASPSGDNTVICADLGGAGGLRNVFTHSLGGTMAAGDIRTRQRFATTFKLPGYGGSTSDNAAVVTYLTGRNTLVNVPTATATNGITSGDPGANGYINGSCLLPVFP